MKKVIEKLHKELSQYLSDVEKSSPSHILLESYQIEMKCHLVSAMTYIADNGMLRKLSGPTCWCRTAP